MDCVITERRTERNLFVIECSRHGEIGAFAWDGPWVAREQGRFARSRHARRLQTGGADGT